MLQIWVNTLYKLGQLRFSTNLGKSVITKLGQVLLQIMAGITNWHCVKSVQIRSYFWYVFSCIRIEYGIAWGNLFYETGQLLQIGVKFITN